VVNSLVVFSILAATFESRFYLAPEVKYSPKDVIANPAVAR
jgi:hypothetical protein